MKILIAAPSWPYRGGIAEFSNRLATQFKADGHSVRIATFRLQYPSFLFPGKTQYTDSPAPEGLEITRSMNSVNPLNWIMLGRKIRREKPDILLLRFWLPFMGPCLGTISRIARRNKQTKVICIFDNVIPHEKRPGDRILTKYLVNSIDGAIVMAGAVGEDLKQFRTNIPVKLNPHPIFDTYGPAVSREAALRFLKLSGEHRYILFFGFIRAYKGLDMLLEAMSYPEVRKIGCKLIVAGEFYEDDAPYRELIRKNGLDENVILFDHFIRDNEVPSYFCSADMVVQPYKSATQSGVTQIAFRYEKPMLVTDVGGLREIVPDKKCGYVVQPGPKEISQAIIDFFENNRIESFTECVKQEKGKFAWERMTESIIEVYDQTR